MNVTSTSRSNGKPARGAIIGFGVIAGGHVSGIDQVPDLEIGVVVDPVLARREAACDAIPGVIAIPHIKNLPTGLDFIAICTPPAFHLDYISYGLRAGLDVLCEKPLVISAAQCNAVESLVRRSRGFLMPCHNYRYAPSLRALSDRLETRAASEPLIAHFRTLRTNHARGVSEWLPDWRRLPEVSGGGILWDHGPHSIYLAMTIIGSYPARVRCNLRRPNGGRFAESEEFAFIHLSFADGSLIYIELDWKAAIRQTSYLVSGSWGHCRVIDDSLEWAVNGAVGTSNVLSDFNDPLHRAWFTGVWQEFLAARTNRSIADRALNQAVLTVRVIDACYQSADRGGTWIDVVSLDLSRGDG